MVAVTREMAAKVRDTVDAGLVAGLGKPVPGQMCVEAAVCYAMGLPHSDQSACVSPALRALNIGLNDSAWSSPEARAKGLRRLALAQLGSAGVLDEPEFARRVVEMTIRKAVPLALRAAATVNPAHAATMEAAAVRCEQYGADGAADADAAAYVAAAAAYVADAAAYVANAAAYADAGDAGDAAYARARDRVRADYCEWVVEILIDMQAPGCQWLDLVPADA